MAIIYKILIFFIIFYLLFDRLTREYLNPYKLIMVFGKKGAGKTTYLTKQAIKHIKKGMTVYSTVDIPGCRKFDVADLGKNNVADLERGGFMPNSLLLIDEVGMIWDARDFAKFPKYVRDFFKYQRQYKLKVIMFSQTFDVDLKLRNLTDEMYLLQNFMRVFSVARRIKKNLTISHNEEKQGTLIDDYQFCSLLESHSIEITFIPRWVHFFKSYNPPPLLEIKYNELPFDEQQYYYLSNINYIKYMIIHNIKKLLKFKKN